MSLLSSGTKLQLSAVRNHGQESPTSPKDLLFLGLLGETRLRKMIPVSAKNSVLCLQLFKATFSVWVFLLSHLTLEAPSGPSSGKLGLLFNPSWSSFRLNPPGKLLCLT